MLLDYHKGYTEAALKNLGIGSDVQKEIITGSTANDLCELTDIIEPFITSKDFSPKPYSKDFSMKPQAAAKRFSIFAFYETHFGDLSSMHAMSKQKGEKASETRREVELWFIFLNQVALEKIRLNPDAKIYSDGSAVSGLFREDQELEYDQIFASERQFKIKNRAVGMMCHLIQDLYTSSHCERDSNGKINKFYHYPLQSRGKHKDGDKIIHGAAQALIQHCRHCVEMIKLKKQAYDYEAVLALSGSPLPSDGGGFV